MQRVEVYVRLAFDKELKTLYFGYFFCGETTLNDLNSYFMLNRSTYAKIEI